MPTRLSKRQQRELEQLTHPDEIEQAIESSGEEDVSFASPLGQSAFAALLSEGGASTEEDTAPEGHTISSKAKKKSKKKKKKPHSTLTEGISPVQTPVAIEEPGSLSAMPSSSQGPTSKKEWKALKKQKAKAKKDGDDDFDKALDELSIKYTDAHIASSSVSKGKGLSSRSLQAECYKLLSVSFAHLNPDAEMRKFFGGKARRQPVSQRSNLTRPQPNWWPAKLRDGLTLRPLSGDEAAAKAALTPWKDNEEKYWTVEYSKRYKSATHAFMQTVLSGDPEGFFAILRHVPWHADTLLQLAELYSHREEHSQAADFIERALFTYERAFMGAFTFTNGLNRLDFDRVENRSFFLALHRQVIDLQRRGIYRTAFEFARLLLSLDPWSDPHGAHLHLDFLAIKSGMHSWLLSFYEMSTPTVSKGSGRSHGLEESQSSQFPVCALPGWAYSRALALRAEGVDPISQSTEALKQAVLDFPSVVPLLADKAEIALSTEVRSHPAFGIHTPHGSDKSSWFSETVTELVQTRQLPSKATATAGFTRLVNLVCRGGEFDASVYRHVVVLGGSAQSLLRFIPAGIVNNNSLACDPLPPSSWKSRYDEDFFSGVDDALTSTVRRPRNAAQTQRLLERLIPDPLFRRQLQDFFAAHPALMRQFPGGVVQFAQVAGNLPEEVLQDIMVNAQIMGEAEAQGALPHGEMPGGLPGDNFVLLDFVGDVDAEGEDPRMALAEGTPVADVADPVPEENVEEDEEDEDEDVDEIAAFPIRVLRNFVGRFWGSSNTGEDSSSEEESQSFREAELDGVD
ncbi:transcriptional repressor TCF25-domain-containing protein [Lactifluus volemus]|nr:transcriptional repressor TCF25-domain-containing protein [Lactifluus volemus]